MKLIVMILSVMILSTIQQEWKAPPEADKLKNPLIGQELAIKEGKKLFATYCAICHGEKGKGDGIAGAALNPKPSNLTTATFHSK